MRREQRSEYVLGNPGAKRGRQQATAARQALVERAMGLVESGAAGIVEGSELAGGEDVEAG